MGSFGPSASLFKCRANVAQARKIGEDKSSYPCQLRLAIGRAKGQGGVLLAILPLNQLVSLP